MTLELEFSEFKCSPDSLKNVELIIQVNLLQELSQGITRYPTLALSQVWRCEGFHRVLNVLFSNQNCPSRIRPHVLTTEVDSPDSLLYQVAQAWGCWGWRVCEQKMRRLILHHRNHRDHSIAKQVSDFISVNMNLLTMRKWRQLHSPKLEPSVWHYDYRYQ